MRARASRQIAEKIAEALVADPYGLDDDLPPRAPIGRFDEAVLISDFLSPVDEIAAVVEGIAGRGARGHLVMIVDPVEETFPFAGQAVLHDLEAGLRAAGRRRRLLGRGLPRPHRAASRRDRGPRPPARLDLHHPPHRPAGERGGAAPRHPRARRRAAARQRRRRTWQADDARPPPHLRGAARAHRARGAAGDLADPAGDAAAAAPDRLPAAAILADLLPKRETPARTPWWLLALRLAARGAPDPRRRRAGLEPDAGAGRARAAAPHRRQRLPGRA